MKEVTYLSPIGKLILIAENKYLVYCNWDEPECIKKLFFFHSLFCNNPEKPAEKTILDMVGNQLDEYFRGERTFFELPIKIIGTPFQKEVWGLISKVNYGETQTYKHLSQLRGDSRSFRAIANACGANPLAIIIPCHRIIGSNGQTGGYTGGIEKKTFLLGIEKFEDI